MTDIRRRKLLAGSALGTLLLGGCDRLSEDPEVQRILASVEGLTRRAQRLLGGEHTLAPEYTAADLSPDFKANGTLNPDDDDYQDMAAKHFIDWRLEVSGLVEHPLRLSLEDLRAMPPRGVDKQRGLDKVFFLVAKVPGRRPALAALRRLVGGDPAQPLRVLEFTAKQNACEYPGRTCGPETCPLARGFYDRLAAARAAALAERFLDRPALRTVALRFAVCPYYLGQELARWCDVIVADYHHYFDSSALLAALTAANEWRVGVLVDEAHNLPARARGMYSATLDPGRFAAARQAAPPALAPLFGRVAAAWHEAARDQAAPYHAYELIPPPLVATLQRLVSGMAEHLAAEAAPVGGDLLEFHFRALQFLRLAEVFGRHSLFDVEIREQGPALTLRNVIPAAFLAPRFAASATCVLFSATLAPAAFYRELLGLPAAAAWVDVDVPFAAEQLVVRVQRRISTRFRDRAASAMPIVQVIAGQYRAQPGNYLAFFSSFDYLGQVLARFRSHCPGIAVWVQERGMSPGAREEFLGRFQPRGRGIGFAVLGGAFAEGIDLPGDRLIGAFIATLGMPQTNPVNAEFARRMHESFGSGYEYTYLYPGLQKVVQAAGRVIRTPTDRGTLVLMDDRFLHAQVRALLPRWWRMRAV